MKDTQKISDLLEQLSQSLDMLLKQLEPSGAIEEKLTYDFVSTRDVTKRILAELKELLEDKSPGGKTLI